MIKGFEKENILISISKYASIIIIIIIEIEHFDLKINIDNPTVLIVPNCCDLFGSPPTLAQFGIRNYKKCFLNYKDNSKME